MLTHIASLEDTVIALSDTEDDSIEHKKAKRVAKKIKRKRNKRKKEANDDSDMSDNNEYIRRSSRFWKEARNNNVCFFIYDNTLKQENNKNDQDMDLGDN